MTDAQSKPEAVMTFRDYIAIRAMSGLAVFEEGWPDPKKVARNAYQIADAMLARRLKPPEQLDKWGNYPE